jgi:3-methyl-2-oxobutanoate hydroxymethyltransferase
MKNEGRKISVVTCYDYSSARAVAASNIDCILVGDSVAMVMHGHATTLSATTAMIALHTAAVARGAPANRRRSAVPFLSQGAQGCDECIRDLLDYDLPLWPVS